MLLHADLQSVALRGDDRPLRLSHRQQSDPSKTEPSVARVAQARRATPRAWRASGGRWTTRRATGASRNTSPIPKPAATSGRELHQERPAREDGSDFLLPRCLPRLRRGFLQAASRTALLFLLPDASDPQSRSCERRTASPAPRTPTRSTRTTSPTSTSKWAGWSPHSTRSACANGRSSCLPATMARPNTALSRHYRRAAAQRHESHHARRRQPRAAHRELAGQDQGRPRFQGPRGFHRLPAHFRRARRRRRPGGITLDGHSFAPQLRGEKGTSARMDLCPAQHRARMVCPRAGMEAHAPGRIVRHERCALCGEARRPGDGGEAATAARGRLQAVLDKLNPAAGKLVPADRKPSKKKKKKPAAK